MADICGDCCFEEGGRRSGNHGGDEGLTGQVSPECLSEHFVFVLALHAQQTNALDVIQRTTTSAEVNCTSVTQLVAEFLIVVVMIVVIVVIVIVIIIIIIIIVIVVVVEDVVEVHVRFV